MSIGGLGGIADGAGGAVGRASGFCSGRGAVGMLNGVGLGGAGFGIDVGNTVGVVLLGAKGFIVPAWANAPIGSNRRAIVA